MNRLVTINAGGRRFQTYLSTVLRYPNTRFARLFDACQRQQQQQIPPRAAVTTAHTSAQTSTYFAQHGSNGSDGGGGGDAPGAVTDEGDVFVDVSPDVFDHILCFLRTSVIHLPVGNEMLRRQVVHHLRAWDLLPHAFPPPTPASSEDKSSVKDGAGVHDVNDAMATAPAQGGTIAVPLPDVCVVQICDHMQHDQGMKRHALTITYGADGCQLRRLTRRIRGDLNTQLSSTYWQCYQTNERAVFFTTTKIANGAADLMTTSITQQLIEHTEQLGYSLVSSYVTLSPDVVHTSVRMFIHHFVFRRQRLPTLELADDEMVNSDNDDDDGDDDNDALLQPHNRHAAQVREEEAFSNVAPRVVGPQRVAWDSGAAIPRTERSRDIWPVTKTKS